MSLASCRNGTEKAVQLMARPVWDTALLGDLAQVQQHATASSCWTVVSGGVYDVTSWIAQHPGGSGPILGLCGKDGTAAFAAQHGTVGRAVNELKQFKIGAVA